jgi:hypothetical protein
LFQFLTVFSHHTEVHGIIFRSLDFTERTRSFKVVG